MPDLHEQRSSPDRLSLFEEHARSYGTRMQRAFAGYTPAEDSFSGFTEHPQAQNPIGLGFVLRRIIRERQRAREALDGTVTVIEMPTEAVTPLHVECFEAVLWDLSVTSKGRLGYFVRELVPNEAGEAIEVEEVLIEDGVYLSRRTTEHLDGLYLSAHSVTEALDSELS